MHITADWVLTPQGLMPQVLLQFDAKDRLVHVEGPVALADMPEDTAWLTGVLCPGFVNAHCHLELSHLHRRIPPGIGMAGFARQIIAQRDATSRNDRYRMAAAALRHAWQTGTQAIGDIANSPDTFFLKSSEPQLQTHTFIELLGRREDRLEEIWANGLAILRSSPVHLSSSFAPHAPYSVSQPLFERIFGYADAQQRPSSLHLLESEDERRLMEDAAGPMADLLEDLQLPMPAPDPDWLARLIDCLPSLAPTLLVHLTEATPEELQLLRQADKPIYYVLCPRSNQFIHGRLPQFENFDFDEDLVCFGTDSLASNDDLSLLEELKLVHSQRPSIPLARLLRAATATGAEALGFGNVLGSLRVGTQPGLLHIQNLSGKTPEDLQLTEASMVSRVV
jgi:cytosine/adenosine deaminase-related metal-dependent hydrolase